LRRSKNLRRDRPSVLRKEQSALKELTALGFAPIRLGAVSSKSSSHQAVRCAIARRDMADFQVQHRALEIGDSTSTGAASRRRSRRAWRSSISSRAGTPLTAAIRPSTFSRRSTTKGAVQQQPAQAQHRLLNRVRPTRPEGSFKGRVAVQAAWRVRARLRWCARALPVPGFLRELVATVAD